MEKFTPKEITETALKLCWDQDLSYDFIDKPTLYIWLSILHANIYSEIVALNNDIDLKTNLIDLVATTDEYTLTVASTGVFGIGTPRRIFLQLTTTLTQYYEAEIANYADLERDEVYYEENATVYKPFVMLKDGDIKIFPTPAENVTSWIKIIANQEPFKILTTDEDDETVLLVPWKYHDLLMKGMIPFIYGQRWSTYDSQKQFAQAEYDKLLSSKLNEMILKDNTEVEWVVPDLSDYE